MKPVVLLIGVVALMAGLVSLGLANGLQVAPTSDSVPMYALYGDLSVDDWWPGTESVKYNQAESPPKVQGVSGLSVRWRVPDSSPPTTIKYYFEISRYSPYLKLAWGDCQATLPAGRSWTTCIASWYNNVTLSKDQTTWYSVQLILQTYNPTMPSWVISDTLGWKKHAMVLWGHSYTEQPPPIPPSEEGNTNTTWISTEATTGEDADDACDPLTEHAEGGVCVLNATENPWQIVARGISVMILILAAILIILGIFL